MTEYTEREKVCELLETISSDIEDIPECGLPQDYIEGWQDAIETAIDKMKSIPTADVRPERHGKWEKSCDGYSYFCSICKEEPDRSGRLLSDFCPWCGAKMDESSENSV